MPQEVVLREKYGAFGREKIYVKPEDQHAIVCVESSVSRTRSFLVRLLEFLRQVFLPQGYPDSVSSDYFNYQLWDTIQAFCSTVTGTLTARAIMAGIGVGSADATPLAAAVTWIFKDGTGMVGSICFAWWKGTSLDADCKKWRLVADGLNDAALCLELLLPFFRDWATLVLCLATTMKAVVGVAGGATRAAITQHQAIRDNMADVSAKDGSQERFVNLTASLVGIFLLSAIPEGWFVWLMFAILTTIHLYANYKAVKSLTMTTLNRSRYHIIMDSWDTEYSIDLPKNVNKQESVIIGFGPTDKHDRCGFRIVLGASISSLVAKKVVTYEQIKLLQNSFKDESYMCIPDLESRTISVVFKPKETSYDVIKAYFHAMMMAYFGNINNEQVHSSTKDQKKKLSPFEFFSDSTGHGLSKELGIDVMEGLSKLVNERFPKFFKALHTSGWTTSTHHMDIDEWRVQWTNSS